jgi:6-phosphofructokinase 1
MDGFLGMIESRYKPLALDDVSGILTQGGTILGSTNKADPFEHVVEVDGLSQVVDVSDKCAELYQELGLSALICLGGDGTQTIGGRLAEKGVKVVGVPKTIDKDVVGTDITFGFDSARAMATDAIDRLHTTAASHHRVMVVEVMGRNAGWLALESCVAGGGDIVLIPEIPYRIDAVVAAIKRRHEMGRHFSIVVVAEGATAQGAEQVTKSSAIEGSKARLGGIASQVAYEIETTSGIECRVTVLGHLQRGGAPTAYDRLLATRFAVEAMDLVANERFDRMVAFSEGEMTSVSIDTVIGKQRLVPLDSQIVEAARAVGTTFGSEDM